MIVRALSYCYPVYWALMHSSQLLTDSGPKTAYDIGSGVLTILHMKELKT